MPGRRLVYAGRVGVMSGAPAARPSGTPEERASDSRLGARHRPGDARRAGHADQDVLRLRRHQGRPAQHAHLPGAAWRTPGALPVVNQRAVEYAARIAPGAALHRAAAQHLPPQELLLSGPAQGVPDQPVRRAAGHRRLVRVLVGDEKLRCRINRVHMEEDAAKLVHAGGEAGRIAGSDYSLVDFNRGGTPLIEIVTEPDIPSPEAAREFLQQLRQAVIELGVSECNMEEGQVRWDANMSVRPAGSARARHAHGAQEHEQLPLPAAGAGGRDTAPDRRSRGGRQHRAGDAALRPGHGHHHAAALQGGGARLPLLPRAGPGAAGHRPRLGGAAARHAAGAARGARRALHGAVRPEPRTTPACWAAGPRWPTSTSRWRRWASSAKPAANWVHGRVPGAPQRGRPRGRPRPRDSRAPGARWSGWWRTAP